MRLILAVSKDAIFTYSRQSLPSPPQHMSDTLRLLVSEISRKQEIRNLPDRRDVPKKTSCRYTSCSSAALGSKDAERGLVTTD